MTTRVYVVTNTSTDQQHLVRATSQAQATGLISKDLFVAKVANQDSLISLMKAGIPVQDASAEEPAETEATETVEKPKRRRAAA